MQRPEKKPHHPSVKYLTAPSSFIPVEINKYAPEIASQLLLMSNCLKIIARAVILFIPADSSLTLIPVIIVFVISLSPGCFRSEPELDL